MSNSSQEKFSSKPFYCRLSGEYALFTDPATKGGGEKYSYSLPTYEALKGMIDGIYWKPTIQNIVDECKIMNPIYTQTKGVLVPLNDGSQDRYYYTYLCNVCYEVKYHFEWNEDRPDLKKDRNEVKHTQIILRSLERGGRRDIFLGARECLGYAERLTRREFEKTNTAYENQNLDFGIQFHSFSYPGYEDIRKKPLIANFDRVKLIDGRITFRRPEDCSIHHEITNYNLQYIQSNELEFVDEALKTREYRKEEI